MKPGEPRRTDRACRILLWLAMATYAVVFSAITLTRHARLGSTIFDLGIFDQTVWLISHGHSPNLSTRGMNAFADHFDPILVLVAPLYWLCDSPKTLLVLQAVILALGALPLYHLARRRLASPGWALLLSVAYLLYAPMQWFNLFDFHPDSFAPVLVLSALWFLEIRRFAPYFLMLVLLLMCKESMGLTVMAIGVYAYIVAGRRAGGLTAALGMAGLLIAMTTIRTLNHGAQSQYLSFYAQYGDSLPSIAVYMLTHPLRILSELASPENTQYLSGLLLPVLFLPLAAPEYLLPALPALLANMLSTRPGMHSLTYQYNAVIVPFVFLATLEGVRQVRLILPARGRRGDWSRAILAAVPVVGIAWSVAGGPLGPNPPRFHAATLSTEQGNAAIAALRAIPSDASVCAQTAIGAHLTHRTRLYMLPNPFQEASWGNDPRALAQQEGREFTPHPAAEVRRKIANSNVDYVVLGPYQSSTFPLHSDYFRFFARLLLTDPHYAAVAAEGDVVVLKRGADPARGRALLAQALSSGHSRLLPLVGLEAAEITRR